MLWSSVEVGFSETEVLVFQKSCVFLSVIFLPGVLVASYCIILYRIYFWLPGQFLVMVGYSFLGFFLLV